MASGSAHLRLRDYVEDLASLGWLREVDKPVHKDWEIACIGRWALESTGEDDAYSIRFNRVVGHDMPVVIGLFASRRHAARSLGVPVAGIWERWVEALSHPIAPRPVAGGSCKQVVFRAADVDLARLPIPVWTPGRDRAPYLSSACIVSVDRGTRVPNLATYRVELQGPRRLGLFFGSDKQHGAMHLKTWERHGEPMPVALVLGAAPAVSYAAAAKVRYGVDEMAIAGGLAGQAIPVTRCETSDLLVPADAEIVIEGFVRPAERADEGPFGEALGYMEGVAPAAVIDVACVSRRADAIFHGLVQQVPPSEGHLLMELGLVGSLWHTLRRQAGTAGVVDLGIVPGAAGVSVICASVRRGDRASVAAVVRVMSLLNWGQKLVVIVDDDIDVHDPTSIFWALSSRVDFSRDVSVQERVPLFQRDPAAFKRALDAPATGAGEGSKMIVDATIKADCMDVSLPTPPFMRRAREAWAETGLPPLAGVSRLERLLEAHAEAGIEYRLNPGPTKEGAPR
jgi:UbiD family decarboxylase